MGVVKDEIYKCDQCGNVVYVLEEGDADLICCGEAMRQLNEEERKAYARHTLKPGSP
jgi:superoxide reductase